jgi:glycosyltransferase involved in cell wall biosynthesis
MKPHILFIIHLPPPVHGAGVAGRNIKESQLINASFDNFFINLTTANTLVDIGKIRFKKLYSIVSLWLKVFRTLINYKFDLCFITINSNGPAWYKEMVIVVLAKLFSVPIIYFYHNKGVASYSNTTFKKHLFRFQFENTKTILLSPMLFYDVSAFVKESDVFYCPYGIRNQSYFNSDEFKIEKPKITTILFFSNLIDSKGVNILLDACYILKEKNIHFRCKYVGGEGDISAIQFNKRVRKMGLQNYVCYLGKKYGIEKEIAFTEADIFAFPTFYHNECFPLVLLEAMQASLPVISTYEGGIPDIVKDGETGYLVPQRDILALADRMEQLILNPELCQRMGAAGRKRYEELFTVEIFENRLLEILKQVSLKYS